MENVAALGPHAANARGSRVVPAVGVWAEWAALGAVYAVSAGSLAGFAVFSRRPELLNEIPGAAAVYARMFVLAPRVQIALALGALLLTVFVIGRLLARIRVSGVLRAGGE